MPLINVESKQANDKTVRSKYLFDFLWFKAFQKSNHIGIQLKQPYGQHL